MGLLGVEEKKKWRPPILSRGFTAPPPWPTSPADCPWIRTVISFGISFLSNRGTLSSVCSVAHEFWEIFHSATLIISPLELAPPPPSSPRIPRNDVLNSQRKTGRIFVENSESRRYEEVWLSCGFSPVYWYYFTGRRDEKLWG